jgi:hypothetical protein
MVWRQSCGQEVLLWVRGRCRTPWSDLASRFQDVVEGASSWVLEGDLLAARDVLCWKGFSGPSRGAMWLAQWALLVQCWWSFGESEGAAGTLECCRRRFHHLESSQGRPLLLWGLLLHRVCWCNHHRCGRRFWSQRHFPSPFPQRLLHF